MRSADVQGGSGGYAEVGPLNDPSFHGVSIASFAGLSNDGKFMISLGDHGEPRAALSTVALSACDAGARVVVAFADGDKTCPIIIGRLQEAPLPSPAVCTLDGERLVLRAEREIELRCGDASIVLTRAGKVLIKGNFVLSRSRGANKIKGAYVDIN